MILPSPLPAHPQLFAAAIASYRVSKIWAKDEIIMQPN